MAVTAGCLSVTLMVVIGFMGPSAAVARFPAAFPSPPWFISANPPLELVSKLMWLAVALGGVSLLAGLAAVSEDGVRVRGSSSRGRPCRFSS